MAYHRVLPGGLVVRSTDANDAEALEQLQDDCFPTLAADQKLRSEHFRYHVTLFSPGQFVVADECKVIGSTTSIRLSEKTLHEAHNFADLFAGGWLNSHEPTGEWLYGIDMGVDAAYRGRGIGRALYVARHATVRSLGLKGQWTVGMLSGYATKRSDMTIEEYYRGLERGELTDPTVTVQLKIGFELRGLVHAYLDDPVCDGCGAALELPESKQIDDRPERYK
jgi:GNAT superfamily N-acetyltransferase